MPQILFFNINDEMKQIIATLQRAIGKLHNAAQLTASPRS